MKCPKNYQLATLLANSSKNCSKLTSNYITWFPVYHS